VTNNKRRLAVACPIITGGQFGSEGKGAFIDEISDDYAVHVRVGGPQAGHSIIRHFDTGPRVFKFQVVPVGAARGKTSVIAMASVLDIDQMETELGWVRSELGQEPDVLVDYRCTVLDPNDVVEELAQGMIDRLGSTAHGVGHARAERIMRRASTAADHIERLENLGAAVVDTSSYLRFALQQRHSQGVLVEGAQGHGLSLFSGGFYPYATSNECGPAQAFADLGLPYNYANYFTPVSVFRTFPIRVAGNSGPLYKELTWERLQQRYGLHIPVEQTTVTKKVRRVGEWDPGLARVSVLRHGVAKAVLSFLDYPFPEIQGETDWSQLPQRVIDYIHMRQLDLGVPIVAVGTGFGTYAWGRI